MNNTQSWVRSRIVYLNILSVILFIIVQGCVSVNSSDWQSRLEAVNKTTDESVLTRVALTDLSPNVVKAAVSRITIDTNLLVKIALKSASDETAVLASSKVDDQTLLSRIAIGACSAKARESAAERLSDPVLLSKVAIEATNTNERLTSVARINDEKTLYEIVVTSHDESVRKMAFDRLNASGLVRLAKECVDRAWRIAAIQRLKNQSLLEDLSVHDSDAMIRDAAAQRVDALRLQAKIILGPTFDRRIREIEIGNADDQPMLERLAFSSDDDEWVRKAAIWKLASQDKLAKLASSDAKWSIRKAAFGMLDQNGLRMLAETPAVDASMHLAVALSLGGKKWSNETMLAADNKEHADILLGAAALFHYQAAEATNITGICQTYLKQKEIQRISELQELLFLYGSESLADGFVSSGNPLLLDAGRVWKFQQTNNSDIGNEFGYRVPPVQDVASENKLVIKDGINMTLDTVSGRIDLPTALLNAALSVDFSDGRGGISCHFARIEGGIFVQYKVSDNVFYNVLLETAPVFRVLQDRVTRNAQDEKIERHEVTAYKANISHAGFHVDSLEQGQAFIVLEIDSGTKQVRVLDKPFIRGKWSKSAEKNLVYMAGWDNSLTNTPIQQSMDDTNKLYRIF